MAVFELISALVTLTAAFSFANRRFLGLPATIGVTLVGLAVSAAVLLLVALHVPSAEAAQLLRGCGSTTSASRAS